MNAFANNWMNIECIMFSEKSQTEKDNCCRVITRKVRNKQTNDYKKIETDSQI